MKSYHEIHYHRGPVRRKRPALHTTSITSTNDGTSCSRKLAIIVSYIGLFGCLFLHCYIQQVIDILPSSSSRQMSIRTNDECYMNRDCHKDTFYYSVRQQPFNKKGSLEQSPNDVSKEWIQQQQADKNASSSSVTIPAWITEYLDFHRSALEELNKNPELVRNYKYLIARCLLIDVSCGGASDRLQSIPLMLKVASQYQRLLFIEWERPARLDEFLIPPEDGIDWRLPDWLRTKLKNKEQTPDHDEEKKLYFRLVTLIHSNAHLYRLQEYPNRTIADIKYQTADHGQSYYDENRLSSMEPKFDEIYSTIWKLFFQPSPPVQELIDKYSNNVCSDDSRSSFNRRDIKQCLNGDYVSVHIRSLYFKDKTGEVNSIQNAVNCAIQLAASNTYSLPGQTSRQLGNPLIFVASDSLNVTRTAIEYGANKLHRTVVGRISNESTTPLHLDRGSNFLMNFKTNYSSKDWMEYPPSAYYDIFVDLYLLSKGRCVTYNVGGYGYWASLISGNLDCRLNHQQITCNNQQSLTSNSYTSLR